jgi:hypothetical protein
MKKVLLALFIVSVIAEQAWIEPVRAEELDYPILDRLALPDSMLPPGYRLDPRGAFPKIDDNPLVTTDTTIVRFISYWFVFGFQGQEPAEGIPGSEKELEEFVDELSSRAKVGYLAKYLPGPGKGSDEIGIMALILEPGCTALDGVREGIIFDNLMVFRADSLAVYAFTDISAGFRLRSVYDYYEKLLKQKPE